MQHTQKAMESAIWIMHNNVSSTRNTWILSQAMIVLQQHFRLCSKSSPRSGTQTNGFQSLPVHEEVRTQAYTDDPCPGAGLWMQQRCQSLHWHPHTLLGHNQPRHCGHTGTQCQGNCQPLTQPSSSAQEEAPQAWRWTEPHLACFCSHTINKRTWNICPELPCDAQWVSPADWVTVTEKPEQCLWYPVPDVLGHGLYRQSERPAWLTGACCCSVHYTVSHISPCLPLQSLRDLKQWIKAGSSPLAQTRVKPTFNPHWSPCGISQKSHHQFLGFCIEILILISLTRRFQNEGRKRLNTCVRIFLNRYIYWFSHI